MITIKDNDIYGSLRYSELYLIKDILSDHEISNYSLSRAPP